MAKNNTTSDKNEPATMNDNVVPAYNALIDMMGSEQKTITLTGVRMNSEQGTLLRTHTGDSSKYTRAQVSTFLESLYSRVRTVDEEQVFDAPQSAMKPDGDSIVVTVEAKEFGAKGYWLDAREESIVNGVDIPESAETMEDIMTILAEPFRLGKKPTAPVGLSTLKRDNSAWKDARDGLTLTKAVIGGSAWASLARSDSPFKSQKQAINKTAYTLGQEILGKGNHDFNMLKETFAEAIASACYPVASSDEVVTGDERINAYNHHVLPFIPEAQVSEKVEPKTTNAVPTAAREAAAVMPASEFNTELFNTLMAAGVEATEAARIASL